MTTDYCATCSDLLDQDCSGDPRCPQCDPPCPCCSDGDGPCEPDDEYLYDFDGETLVFSKHSNIHCWSVYFDDATEAKEVYEQLEDADDDQDTLREIWDDYRHKAEKH